MSLQVWLPLNGDLRNQGLSDVTINGTPSFSDNGKIGTKCLTSSNTISFNTPAIDGSKIWSFCFWGYIVSSSITSNWTGIVYLTDGSSSFRLEVCPLGYVTNNVYCYSAHNNSGCALTTGSISTPSGTDYYDRWVHCCITCDGTTITKYMDGVQVGTCAYNGTGTTTGTLNLINNNKIYKNDVRVYSHCLSPKEVKEIAKGLVLHYKLDDGYVESTTNLSARNGTGGWNNSGTSSRNNNDTSFELIPIRECPVYSITQTTAGQSAITFGTATISGIHTITASMWFYMNSVNTSSDVGPYIRSSKTDSSLASFKYNNSTNFRTWPQKEWIYITATCTTSSEETGVYLCAYTSGLNQIFAFNGWQIEEKDHATPYTPTSRTGNIVYDSSGNGYDGTVNGSLTTSSDSARYLGSTVFDGNTASITLGNLSTICPEGNFTFNCWIYKDGTWSTKNWETIFGGPSGFELETKYSSTNSPVIVNYNWGKTSMPYNLNEWTMITMTRNSSETKYYINGNLAGTGTAGTIPSGNYFIGAWGNSAGQNYKGKVSDVRIYNTVLSESDIKELYETSASIDKNGSFYCREFVEV